MVCKIFTDLINKKANNLKVEYCSKGRTMKFSMKYSLMMIISILVVTVNAVNVGTNGSFEEEGECPKYDTLVNKGFTLNFEKDKWVKHWTINPATKRADVTLVSSKEAVDGNKYLEIKNSEGVHVYSNKKLPGDFSYGISFSARAPAGKNKMAIHVYVYNAENNRYIESKIIKEFEPTNKWEKHSLKLPKYGNDKFTKLGFRIYGACDLDNVIIKMEE